MYKLSNFLENQTLTKDYFDFNLNKTSYLGLIVGPMFSGKTTALLKIYETYYSNTSIIIINHSLDDRYTNNTNKHLMYNHNLKNAPCLITNNLTNEWRNNKILKDTKIILINEGQFFEDLYDIVKDMLENKDRKSTRLNSSH